MNGGGPIICACGQQFPLLPNLALYRPSLPFQAYRAKVVCPWCEHVHGFTVDFHQFRLWEKGRDDWASDFFEVLAGFRLDAAVAGDRVCELLGVDDA